MTPLEAILKIKAMFAEAGVEVAAVEPVAVEPAVEPIESAKEYKLKSGVTVLIDKLEIGGKVEVLGEDGQLSAAPAGEHELVDGKIIVVDESGMIAEVKEVVVEEPAVEVEVEAGEDYKKKEEELMKKMEEMQKELDELKKKQSMMEASAAKFESAIPQLTDIVIGLMNTPSMDSTEQPKNKFEKHFESHDMKMNKFLELAKSLKK